MKKIRHKKIAPFEIQTNCKPKINAQTCEINREQLKEIVKDNKIMNKKLIFNIFFKIIGYFLLFLLLFNAKISFSIAPFVYGFGFALIFFDEKIYLVGPIFVLAAITINFSVYGFISACCTLCSILILGFLRLVTKKKIPIYLYPAFLLLGLVGHIYFNVGTRSEILQTIVLVIVAEMFFFICVGFLRSLKTRGLANGFTLDEKICFGIFLMALALGLYDVYIWKFCVYTIVVCFCMLCISKLWGKMAALCFCALAGFGLAFANNSLVPLAIFCSWALVVAALGNVNRYVAAIGVFVMDFLLGAYFHGYAVYTWVQMIDILLPGLVFCVMPNKVFDKLSTAVDFSKSAGGMMFLDLDRANLRQKVLNVSKIFENMGETYKRIGQVENWNDNPKEQIANEVVLRLCGNCENYARCMREKNMYDDIVALARVGAEKHKASVLDISKNIAINCTKTTSLLSCINHASEKVCDTAKIVESENGGRIAIGEQLLGTSKILSKMAEDLSSSLESHKNLSDELFEELLACDIVARDIVVADKKGAFCVTMIVKNSENEEKIAECLKNCFGFEFYCKTQICKYAGCKLLELLPKQTFDISVGVASVEKQKGLASGDVFSFVELDDNKVLLVLCDGMGSGDVARSASEEVVTLVENFYRAGFDSDLILKNVSRLLSTSGREVFSTLDVCVFDKSNGNVDFVKACAPPTLVKGQHETIAIETQSLPIGIVALGAEKKNMRLLSKGEVVVMVSDGVFDCFASLEEFESVVNDQTVVNMNLLCENILEEAKARGGEQKDDMTIVAFRVV